MLKMDELQVRVNPIYYLEWHYISFSYYIISLIYFYYMVASAVEYFRLAQVFSIFQIRKWTLYYFSLD